MRKIRSIVDNQENQKDQETINFLSKLLKKIVKFVEVWEGVRGNLLRDLLAATAHQQRLKVLMRKLIKELQTMVL